MRRTVATWVALAVASLTLVACSDEPTPAEPADPAGALTFGVYGPNEEIAAYRSIVDDFNRDSSTIEVELVTFTSAQALLDAVEAGGAGRPDVFLASNEAVDELATQEINQPLFELLEARNISTGDDFNHDALLAFSENDDLQCVPMGISPMVIYYNTDLIDFEQMQRRELPVPEDQLEGWNLEEFQAAAQAATSRRGDTRGISIEPRLDELAPFLLSGGGSVFDDAVAPTRTTLSEGSDLDALTTTLELLRDPDITLTAEQLDQADPLTWFEQGKLGMIEGDRSLTPQLRAVEGLNFDVMPMPSLGTEATVGTMTGACISAEGPVENAADFLVYALAAPSMEKVAAAGYQVPATVAVARSDAFLQPDQEPANAGVFNVSADEMTLLPKLDDAALAAAIEPGLEEMLRAPAVVDLEALAATVDEASRTVLDPTYVPTETPTD